jgi:23S rRNA (uracil1939-C5)-methyltransferase
VTAAPEPIIRLAAKGDGVTASGRHVAGAVPGDMVDEGGAITPGPHHQAPPCRHFASCGGCQLQYADDAALSAFVESRVVFAARGQGLEADDVLPVHLSPPHRRRRAGLHGLRTARGAVLGYREGGSHRVVDLAECPVLHPDLAALIPPLRAFVAAHGPRGAVGIDLTRADQGVEANLSHFPLEGLGPTEAALNFAQDQSLARLTFDQGYGPETVWEPEPVTITLTGVPVGLPPGGFLQATLDAETRMAADAAAWLEGARVVADLFAGLGTFAFALREGRKVLAVEAERAAYLACKTAGARAGGAGTGGVLALHRDLFRSPLESEELNRFEAVLLDPPRAGARAQVAEIAKSALSRVVYVSCNPSSWARDAAVLGEAGFRLAKLRPVGQFRWSTHVELVSLFTR